MDAAAARNIAEGLKAAIEAEQNGYHFYMMAARSTEDEQGREVFEQLANEELDHVSYLKQQHRSLMEKGVFDPEATMGRRTDLSGDSPIFSDKLKARAADAHFEMSALSIGMNLELIAVKFYKGRADASDDPRRKDLLPGARRLGVRPLRSPLPPIRAPQRRLLERKRVRAVLKAG